MELLKAAIEFLTVVIQNPKISMTIWWIILTIQTIYLYGSTVINKNRGIILRRKELGMNETDQAVLSIHKILFDHYRKLAEITFGEDYFNKKEVAIYRYLLTMSLEDRKPVYRARIRRNHFDEKSASEWQRYVHDCIEEDINSVSNFLDTHYHPQATITRPQLLKWNEEKLGEIRKELEHLFSQLLCISENNKMKKFFFVKLELGG